jgi:hypothetical protein
MGLVRWHDDVNMKERTKREDLEIADLKNSDEILYAIMGERKRYLR